jgi:tRNA nucleotidyltransferase/poly(A) polymerase
MDVFVVGGCVRDILMGKEPSDIDYVVVNSTHDEMISLGYTQVGASFPVYLNPDTGDEYALARTERKTGVGYHGFDHSTDGVSLGDDLLRRDLTCNSMAVRVEDWEAFKATRDESLVVDPYNGITAIKSKVLTHTSVAFGEDPVRVLRTARFAARYHDFSIADETLTLMASLASELNHVSVERIWLELEKALQHKHFYIMIDVLRKCGVLDRVDALSPLRHKNAHVAQWQRALATDNSHAGHRFALAGRYLDDEGFEALKVPNHYAQYVRVYKSVFYYMDQYPDEGLSSHSKVELFDALRGFNNRDNEYLHTMVTLFECKPNFKFPTEEFYADLDAARSVDTASIAKHCTSGDLIKSRIFNARIQAIMARK